MDILVGEMVWETISRETASLSIYGSFPGTQGVHEEGQEREARSTCIYMKL